MIEIKDLHYGYNKQDEPVLKGVDLVIEPGQWLTVVGRNGSGKSTLARCINGLFQPDSGQVLVDGLDTQDDDQLYAIREKVAFVFQNPDNQFVATSVEDDVAFGLENLGLPREEITSRVEEALSVMRLSAERDKAPHMLSGGEKQRVAIAGALAMASTYLVLDEPTAMLDPLMRREVLDSVVSLHKERGLTIIYVTNIMEEVLLADRVILLDDGRVARDCTPAELFSDPDFLTGQGLDVPQISRLAARLADAGYPSLRGALDVEQLAERLTQL